MTTVVTSDTVYSFPTMATNTKLFQAGFKKECHPPHLTLWRKARITLNRQSGKVDEQICSRVPQEQCKDVVDKLCNTVYTDNRKPISRDICQTSQMILAAMFPWKYARMFPKKTAPLYPMSAARMSHRNCAKMCSGRNVWMSQVRSANTRPWPPS